MATAVLDDSRPRTIGGALRRLGVQVPFRGARKDVLTLLVVGADRKEGTCPSSSGRVFCDLEPPSGCTSVQVVLVGPGISLGQGVRQHELHDAGRVGAAGAVRLSVGYHVGRWHDMPGGRRGDWDGEPWFGAVDLALAFNAGIYGYGPEEWLPTLRMMLQPSGLGAASVGDRFDGAPYLVLTGYSLHELEDDEEAIRELLPHATWAWEPEVSPHASHLPRILGTWASDAYRPDAQESPQSGDWGLADNAAWCCCVAAPPL